MRKGIDYTAVGVCTMCHDGKGKYLVGQRSPEAKDEHYTWHPIGTGAIEMNETIEDAVRREVMEECGAEAHDLEFIGFRETFREYEGKPMHWIHFDYKARIDPSKVSIKEPDKCIDMKWVTIDTIPEPRHSTFPAFIEKYKDTL